MATQYTVSRSVSIAAPAERIRPLINDFHQWVQWSPWEGLDPGMRRTYSGADSGLGARYAWEGNKKAGKGNMAIIADAPESVGIDLRFEKPFPSHSSIEFLLRPAGDTTTVEWRMTGEYSLFARVFALVKSMDSMIGPDFAKGLARLKTVAEGEPTG